MPYDDLSHDEKLRFHDAVIEKHQTCKVHLLYSQSALTDGERDARAVEVGTLMNAAVSADSFKTPVQEEPTPSVEETQAALEGEQ